MDTSKLDNFVRIVQDESHNLKIVKLLRASDNLREYRRNIQHKETVFESAVVEFCCMYGDNANKALGLYRDKLICGYKRQQARSNQHSLSSLPESERNHINLFYRIFLSVILKAIKCLDNILSMDSSQELHQSKQKVYSINDDDLHNEQDEISEAKSIHYTTTFSNKELKRVYNYLVDNGHLEQDNLLSDFIYFFTGRGKKVNNGLKWKSDKVRLAYFIDTIIVKGGSKEKKFWKKAEIIFGEVGLANKYSQTAKNNNNSQNEKLANGIKRLLKIE